jgi:glycerol-3-phosphate dehydrogenase
MNIALIMTAIKWGAVVVNHTQVSSLNKDSSGKICGARVRDNLTGEEWDVKAKVSLTLPIARPNLTPKFQGVINATGPFTDTLLAQDAQPLEKSAAPVTYKPIVAPSAGTHITLPNYYSPRTMGLLDPATSDGRVIFFLPWQGITIAGTTDSPSDVESEPRPREDDIQWILEEIQRYIAILLDEAPTLTSYLSRYLSPDIKVRRGDVLSSWTGIRPLVRDPSAGSSANLVRSHMIHVSDSGLLTAAGGKWTTYRSMAQDCVDKAIEVFGFPSVPCRTEKIRLLGSDGWSPSMFIGLVQRVELLIHNCRWIC